MVDTSPSTVLRQLAHADAARIMSQDTDHLSVSCRGGPDEQRIIRRNAFDIVYALPPQRRSRQQREQQYHCPGHRLAPQLIEAFWRV